MAWSGKSQFLSRTPIFFKPFTHRIPGVRSALRKPQSDASYATRRTAPNRNVLLEPFPCRQAERILSVQVHDLQSSQRGGRGAYTTPEFLQLLRQSHTLITPALGSKIPDCS